MNNENTVFKDEAGNKVEFFKFIEMMESGEWSSEPVKNEKGKLQYVQLKKKQLRYNLPPLIPCRNDSLTSPTNMQQHKIDFHFQML